MGKILVIGATSEVAYALSKLFTENKHELFLTGRNEAALDRLKENLKKEYQAETETMALDVLNPSELEQFKHKIATMEIDGVVVAYGYLGEQEKGQTNETERHAILTINFNSVVDILEACAERLEKKKSGFICAISSVAGDRGRQSNYLYGAAKGALSLYLQGLRNRLSKSNVHVLTVKPGFIYTKMTKGKIEKTWMVATPEKVANDIYKGIQKRKNVLYTPFFWRYIMLIIKSIPENIFKKMKL